MLQTLNLMVNFFNDMVKLNDKFKSKKASLSNPTVELIKEINNGFIVESKTLMDSMQEQIVKFIEQLDKNFKRKQKLDVLVKEIK